MAFRDLSEFVALLAKRDRLRRIPEARARFLDGLEEAAEYDNYQAAISVLQGLACCAAESGDQDPGGDRDERAEHWRSRNVGEIRPGRRGRD